MEKLTLEVIDRLEYKTLFTSITLIFLILGLSVFFPPTNSSPSSTRFSRNSINSIVGSPFKKSSDLYPNFSSYEFEIESKNPIKDKKSTQISINIRKKENCVYIYGILKTKEENLRLENEKISIFNVYEGKKRLIGQTRTKSDGKYIFSKNYPKEKGIYFFAAEFNGESGYEGTSSKKTYLIYLNKTIILIVLIFLIILSAGIIEFLTKDINFKPFLIPLLLGTFLSVFLTPISAVLGPLSGGILAVALYSGEVQKWESIKIGITVGLFLISVSALLYSFKFFGLTEPSFGFTIRQKELIKRFSFRYIKIGVIFSLLSGIGGGLGKFLKKVFEK